MWADLRKTALFAGIALAVTDLWNSFGLLALAFALPRTSPGLIATAVLMPLPDLPFVLLLLLLSRPGTLLAVSEKQQYVAWALAVIRAVSFVLSGVGTWRLALRGGPNPTPGAGNIPFWASQSSAGNLISDALSALSGIAVIVFLAALARQVWPPRESAEARPRLIRNIALLAVITRAFVLAAVLITQLVMATYRIQTGSPPGALSALRLVIFGLPGLLAPMIIYSSVRRPC